MYVFLFLSLSIYKLVRSYKGSFYITNKDRMSRNSSTDNFYISIEEVMGLNEDGRIELETLDCCLFIELFI